MNPGRSPNSHRQRRTQPNEEQAAQKALGDTEQLPRQPARLTDAVHHKPSSLQSPTA